MKLCETNISSDDGTINKTVRTKAVTPQSRSVFFLSCQPALTSQHVHTATVSCQEFVTKTRPHIHPASIQHWFFLPAAKQKKACFGIRPAQGNNLLANEKSLTEAIFFPLQRESLFFTLVSLHYASCRNSTTLETEKEINKTGVCDLTHTNGLKKEVLKGFSFLYFYCLQLSLNLWLWIK